MSNLGTKLMSVQKRMPKAVGSSFTLPAAGSWQNIEYNSTSNTFAAVDYYNFPGNTTTNKAAWSSNGRTWTAATLPASDVWCSRTCLTVAFNNFVALGVNGRYAYSATGATWTAGTALPTYGYSIAYSSVAGCVVAIAQSAAAGNGTPIKTFYRQTALGGAWTTYSGAAGFAYFPDRLRVANGVFYTYGYNAATDANPAVLMKSTNGINWTTQAVPPAKAGTTAVNYNKIAYGNGVYVTSGTYQGAGGSNVPVAFSADGVNWTISNTGLPNGFWDSIIFTGEVFLSTNRGVGGGNAMCWYSYDGNMWYPVGQNSTSTFYMPNGGYYFDVAYGSNTFAAVGDNQNGTNAATNVGVGTML
jgi:hypothetical protein